MVGGLFVALLTVAPHAMQATPKSERGLALYQDCQAQVRVWDTPNDRDVSPADLRMAYECLTYVRGFLDGIDSVESNAICTEGASYGSMIRVYVAFMQNNPKNLDMPMGNTLRSALIETYPCLKK